MPNSRPPLPNITFPTILIFLGLVFLLQNLGILPDDIWPTLIKFWPVVLILIGLQFLLPRSRSTNAILMLTTLSMGCIAVAFAMLQSLESNWPAFARNLPYSSSQSFRTSRHQIDSSDYQLEQIGERVINFSLNLGRLNLTTSNQNRFLSLISQSRLAKPIDLSQELSDRTLNLTAKSATSGPADMFRSGADHQLDLGFPALPTTINLDIGAGSAQLNLDQINLSGVDIDVGLGSATITIGPEATVSGTLDIDVGLGSVDIHLPEFTGYTLDYSVGLGSIAAGSNSLSGSGQFESPNLSSSQLITIRANVGTGSLTITNN